MATNIICPYCFESFSSKKVHYICDRCEDKEDDLMKAFWKEDRRYKRRFVSTGSVYGMFGSKPKEGSCPHCKSKSYRFACPHCHNELVPEMVENGSIIVSIIGGPGSGKTNYITVLINELKKNAYKVNLGFSSTSVGRDSSEYTSNLYNSKYYKVLYEDQRCPDKTKVSDRTAIPLIFRLNVKNTSKTVFVVFYDSAGENFNDPEKMRQNTKFLEKSSGVVLLLDSYSIPAIEKMLQEKQIQTNRTEKDGKLKDTWHHIYSFMTGTKNRKETFSKPFAISLSKIDTILNNQEYFSHIDLSGINLNTTPSYLTNKGFSLAECEVIHESLKSALDGWEQGAFISQLEDRNNFGPEGFRLFAISALGSVPGRGLAVPEVKPFRVMDPLLWVLYKLGFDITIANK